MLKKIRNLLRMGRIEKIKNSNTPQSADVNSFGITKEVVLINPAGFFSYPDKKITALMFQINGNEDNVCAIPFDPKHKPELLKGDVGIGTLNGKMSIICHNDGKIEINGTTDDMVALIFEAIGHLKDTATQLKSTTVPTALGASSLSSAPFFTAQELLLDTLKDKFEAMVKT